MSELPPLPVAAVKIGDRGGFELLDDPDAPNGTLIEFTCTRSVAQWLQDAKTVPLFARSADGDLTEDGYLSWVGVVKLDQAKGFVDIQMMVHRA